jgi:hypothetical protein
MALKPFPVLAVSRSLRGTNQSLTFLLHLLRRTTWTARSASKRWTCPTSTSSLVRAATRFVLLPHLYLRAAEPPRLTPLPYDYLDLPILLSPHQGELEQPLSGLSYAL